MSEAALRYLFILALVLIVVAYFAGSTKVLGSLGTQVGNLGNIFTGRNPTTGAFAPYPTGG